VDFSGSVKRIMFHYAKTSSDRDEWVEFGSSRIAPLFTKLPKKLEISKMVLTAGKEPVTATSSRHLKKKRPKSTDVHQLVDARKVEESPPKKRQKLVNTNQSNGERIQHIRCAKVKVPADPNDEKSFTVGGM
jgi:hypothetical protein